MIATARYRAMLTRAALLATALTLLPAAERAPGGDTANAPAATKRLTLEEQFQDPPASARPRVWWHWMNGNITQDGIAKDLAWMKRVGIGGAQSFDINLATPQIVDHRLVYMSPAWKAAFRFAASDASQLGLELAIASSPGWSETGGPWVAPADGMKKLVWSETMIPGAKPFTGSLKHPPAVAGPFQGIPRQPDLSDLLAGTTPKHIDDFYRDVAVFAVPETVVDKTVTARVRDGLGASIDIASLTDADQQTGYTVAAPKPDQPRILQFDYPAGQTLRSARIFLPGAAIPLIGALFTARLEASADGTAWRKVTDMPLDEVPTTVSFPAVTAPHFRVVIGTAPTPAPAATGPDIGLATGSVFGKMLGGQFAKPVTVGDIRLSPEPRIDRFETKAGFSIARDYYALGAPGDDATGAPPEATIDLTGRMRPDGTLDWTPPPGRWRIIRLGYSLLGTTNHPATDEATGLEVDKFDRTAVRAYLDHYLGMYRAVTGPDLLGAAGVRTMVTDSIEVGASNWTPKLIEQFKKLRGYDPTPWLPTLTGVLIGTREQSDRFLYDYRRTLADLISSEHYGTVTDVAHQSGLSLYGEALESNRPTLGDDMAMRRHADVPMGAMWAFGRRQAPSPNYVADIKGAASVAHLYGQNIVGAESMTAADAPWAFGPADLKRVIDLEFALGVNRPVIHTSVHAPVDDKLPGLSLGGIGQFFNRQESWAELARPWVDYIARNAFLLQQGRNVADVGFIYGEEGPLTALYGETGIRGAPTANGYDFIDSATLLNALRNDGDAVVSPGGARYRLLYLAGSSDRMTLATLRKLAALVEGGATVAGLKPSGSPSLGEATKEYTALSSKLWPGGAEARIGKGRMLATRDIDTALREADIRPDFTFTGASRAALIPFVHRQLADGDSYYLVNRRDQPETIEAHFRVVGKAPQIWHAETGRSEPVSYRIEHGETIVPLTMAGEDSFHVVFRTPAIAAVHDERVTQPVRVVALYRDWMVAFQPGRGAPARAHFQTLAPLDSNTDPGIRYFSGVATYTHRFTTPRDWKPGQKLLLDLGEAKEIAEVRVNGKLAGYAWHAPYQVDIAAVTRAGVNHLEVRVANLWVNRLIGDQQPGATKVTWTGSATYRADAPLRRSGLIGPVTLRR
ncbi:glycosyl hydrolase [Sphingomonas sp. BAUL-RG-20F-R05-02]|uniref:glycosyl hydrolase n=1 Tax=Sphingomonas sp. BAUL-RG-20F-R05-02 TaxID=2914830 RepID=UPI001F55D304|nr:glycosyl hydrolase [Sphingomonas sp. BAUL-RG-20F-R05-02]